MREYNKEEEGRNGNGMEWWVSPGNSGMAYSLFGDSELNRRENVGEKPLVTVMCLIKSTFEIFVFFYTSQEPTRP